MSHSPKRIAELCPKAAELVDRSVLRAGARVTIGAGNEATWALLADPDGWSNWYGGVKDSKGTAPLKIGSKISFKAGPAFFRGRVDELEERHTLRFSGKSQGSSATYLFRLESKGKRTQVFAAVNMGGIIIRATKPVMQTVAERAVLRWLDALAEAVPVPAAKK
jgi:carbon monoxide dehydrogenase subunit G